MTDESAHAAVVTAWASRRRDSSPEPILDGFERVFGALSRRAQVTLSEVTLSAVVDRVLYRARERYRLLTAARLDGPRIRCDELRAQAAELDPEQLVEAVRFVLIEFLTVIGNLTADILTPSLHAELAKEPPGDPADSHSKEPTS
jgi:hypothetical protein